VLDAQYRKASETLSTLIDLPHFPKFRLGRATFVCTAALILAGQPTQGQVEPGSAQNRAQLLGSQANPGYGPNVAPTAENQGYAVASPNETDIATADLEADGGV
jgi:hypothetical protein